MKTVKTNRLSERAMLVHFSSHQWTGRRKDKQVSQDVCLRESASNDAGAWWTYLIPQKELNPVNQARMQALNMHYKMTLPWLDGGLRILPSAMFLEYSKKIREAIAKHEEAVAKFIERYPDIVAKAKERLGKLADNQQLPTVNEIKDRFSIHQDILPMPSTDDFRAAVGDDEIENVRKQITASIETMTAKAMESVWSRLAELISKIEQTLGEPKKIFRDSLITNLKDFCELIPKFNLVQDSNLEKIRKDIVQKLGELKPDTLRESCEDRKKAAKAAKDVLNKMKDYATT